VWRVKTRFTESELDNIRKEGSTGVLIAEIERMEHLYELQRKDMLHTLGQLLNRVGGSITLTKEERENLPLPGQQVCRYENSSTGELVYSVDPLPDA